MSFLEEEHVLNECVGRYWQQSFLLQDFFVVEKSPFHPSYRICLHNFQVHAEHRVTTDNIITNMKKIILLILKTITSVGGACKHGD